MIVVVVAGGAGTRLWPISRESHPKPFLKLSDGQSLLQKTFLRASELTGVENILTVTNRDLYFMTEDEYSIVNSSNIPLTYLLEPMGRNTAPAIVAATLHIAEHFGLDSEILVLPADHLIQNKEAFDEACERAAALSRDGHLVTFGIRPEYPETGYGYIETHAKEDVRVKRFVEKPNSETAKEYIQSGNYFWNSGMFCFTAKTLIEKSKVYVPEIIDKVRLCLSHSSETHNEKNQIVELDSHYFSHVPDISIDYALMEKADNVAVVACDIGWSDIGSWNALNDIQTPDTKGNRIEGEALLHDVQNCYIQSQYRLVGAVGIDNLIVVDTPDALLVANRDRAQEVKHLVSQLKQKGHQSHKFHRTVDRPWGSYTVLEEGENFKIKRLEIKPGGILSLQMHYHRSEHWIVVQGVAKVINGEESFILNTNQSTFIPASHKHRLENPGAVTLVIIEVQSGDYLGEDDIVRFEDRYGRA